MNETITDTIIGVDTAPEGALTIHWRAILAGVVLATLSYLILMSLGLAVGAGQMRDALSGELNAYTLGTNAGIYLLVSVLISLFVGSYASARVSGIIATRIGYTQGAVVTALFFTVMISQVGVALGGLTASLGSLGGVLGGAANQALRSQRLNGVVEDAVSDLRLKTSPNEVATGVLARVLRGDTESAINYLSAQSGLSREQAATRFKRLRADVEQAAGTLARRGADAAQTAGWATFATLIVGVLGGMLGGALGAHRSMRSPLSLSDRRALRGSTSGNGLGQPAFT